MLENVEMFLGPTGAEL